MKKFFTLCFIFFSLFLEAQQICLSPKVINDLMLNTANPQLVLNEINQLKYNNYISTKADAIYEIPVVFHIIHNGDPMGTDENLSDSIILEQLSRINTDFSGSNPDSSLIPSEFSPVFADTQIKFCLAKKDTSGNFTTGIIRHQYAANDFDEAEINSIIKPQTIWNRNDYLNIWIVKFGGNLASNLVNGYATPPIASTPENTDGLVLSHLKVGNNLSNNVGRIAVHEIGHWLGLFHTWGDDNGACTGDDGISDTPNQADSYFNCPSGVPNSCGSNDMYMNYMDYTDAECSLMFTEEQKTQMHFVLNNFRDSLKFSQACKVKDLIVLDDIFPKGSICQEQYVSAVKIKNIGSEPVFGYGYEFYIDNILIHSKSTTDTIYPNKIAYLKSDFITDFPDNNSHATKFVLTTSNDEYPLNNEFYSSFQAINTGTGFEPTLSETFENTSFPPTNMFILNPDGDNTWELFSGISNQLIFIDNFNSSAGKIDAISTTDYDFYSTADISYELNFDYLHHQRSNFNDTLSVYFSIDCGANWFPIWSKYANELSNNISSNTEFLYTNETLNSEKIDLCISENFFCGLKKIRFKFENKSGGGNQTYIDNINFSYKTAVEDFATNKIVFYPNPSKNDLYFSLDTYQHKRIKIYNSLGQQVIHQKILSKENKIDLKDLNNGLYFIEITDENGQLFDSQKLVLKH